MRAASQGCTEVEGVPLSGLRSGGRGFAAFCHCHCRNWNSEFRLAGPARKGFARALARRHHGRNSPPSDGVSLRDLRRQVLLPARFGRGRAARRQERDPWRAASDGAPSGDGIGGRWRATGDRWRSAVRSSGRHGRFAAQLPMLERHRATGRTLHRLHGGHGPFANANPQACTSAEEKQVCTVRPDGLKDCCCRTYSKFQPSPGSDACGPSGWP